MGKGICGVAFKLGITGTIGSGKSLVGQYLELKGIPVLDTDAVVHRLYAEPERLVHVAGLFLSEAPDLITETLSGPQLDRAQLGALLFEHPNGAEHKRRLEGLVHPWVRAETRAFLESAIQPIVAVLVPLLFEADSQDLYDGVWAVTVRPEAVLVERLHKRHPAWTTAMLQSRLASQLSQAEKATRADVEIDNSGTPEETYQRVDTQLTAIQSNRAFVRSES